MCKIGDQEHGVDVQHVIEFTAQYYDPNTEAVTHVQVSGYHKSAALGRLGNISHFYYVNPATGQRALADMDRGATLLVAARTNRKAAWIAADTATDPAPPKK